MAKYNEVIEMVKPKVLVVTGYGINCDIETELAFNLAGADAERIHINDLIGGYKRMDDYQVLALPGGFSFGDDIGSGKVLANKMRYKVGEDVQRFVERDKLVIGICNGAQVAIKYDLLPAFDGYGVQKATLTFNDSGRFEDRWVHLRNESDRCVFTKGIDTVYLPVAHGEGKFVCSPEALTKLKENGQIVFRYVDEKGNPANGAYPINPNGSLGDVAGICDTTGKVFILMPHPERHLTPYTNPRWSRLKQDGRLPDEGDGMRIFRNAVSYVKGHRLKTVVC